MRFWLCVVAALFLAPSCSVYCAETAKESAASPYSQWPNGPPDDPNFFPIAVWLQNPANAARYKACGINVYVALYRGPTAEQLRLLDSAGVRVICGQRRGLEFKDNPAIIGWMHGDEPDNAQSLGQGKGYGPPILPEKIVADYEKMRAADPSRPVLLNLGQGVAWDDWIGRGVRRNHPEDYPEYVKGCDIASFDIYPVVHDSPEVAGKLEFVARGVERLVGWTGGAKPVWNCIEASRISNTQVKPTVSQIRAEVWMSLIHGSRGLIYFVHQFKPAFKEASLLEDAELREGITKINEQIHRLAPVLNSPTVNMASITSPGSAVRLLGKRHGGATYVFVVNMSPKPARATVALNEHSAAATVEVLDESRSIPVHDRQFADDFADYEVHLYRISR